MDCIAYKDGYKYQLSDAYSTKIPIKPKNDIDFDYVVLSSEGIIVIKKGYAWDGPSGPTIDSLNFMRGSLIHDALYQLMREQILDKHQYRKQADKLLQQMCKQDGMSSIRAWWIFKGIRIVGNAAASQANKKPVIRAPKSCQ